MTSALAQYQQWFDVPTTTIPEIITPSFLIGQLMQPIDFLAFWWQNLHVFMEKPLSLALPCVAVTE